MNTNEHLIVYTAPEHAPVPTVECSCGWKVTGAHLDGGSHHEVLNELLARWVSHIEQATAARTQPLAWSRRANHDPALTGEDSAMKVGFIGLGSIGIFMARRLARVGFEVTGCDIVPEMLAAFDEPGAHREADPVATARAAHVLGICVRTDEQLEALTADGTLFSALGEGGIAVIHSTVAPALAQRLANTAAALGVGLIDAGVSPGGPHVGEGKASIFVGGEDDVVARAWPYLEALGRVAHLGPVGRGLEGKLLNNLASTAGYGLAVSILEIGRQRGFDPEALRGALMAGSAQSFALQVAPGLLHPSGPGATGNLESLHALLKKDVDHAAHLADAGDPALHTLLASAQAMLDALKARAAEGQA